MRVPRRAESKAQRCRVATEPPECLGWSGGNAGVSGPSLLPGRAQPGNPAGRPRPAPSRQRKWRELYIRPRLAELGADRQGWGGHAEGGGNARAKSLDHVGCPGGPQERHPRSEAMNASGEGDSFPGSVQSKYYWTDAPSVGSVQPAGPGIWDPGDGAPCMPSPPAPREAGLGAELL